MRIENVWFPTYKLLTLKDRDTLVVFTHEWALNEINKEKFTQSISWLCSNGYKFKFLDE